MMNPALSIRLSLILLVALANALSLSAQEVPVRPASSFLDPQNGTTEADLVVRALASNPTLLAQRQQIAMAKGCLLYTSPSPRDLSTSRMPSSA